MKIIKIDETYAIDVKLIIRAAYLPLLEKYHDEKIGYVRVGQRCEGEYSIADLAIRPEYQGNGYAQFFLKEIEKMYSMAEKWSLVTIMEEKKDCYLYEKLGYEQKGILREVNEGMHFVLYVK